MPSSSEQQDREEILEFLAHSWIPVRQMLRTMSRGDSLTNDIFVNCLVREFRVPNRLIPALSKIVLESCRYHDVVHTETLRKKVDDYRRLKEEAEMEAEQQQQDQQQAMNAPFQFRKQNNNNKPPAGTHSHLNREIYQPPRLRPDGNTQEQMELLQFQQQQSSQRRADRFGEFFDDEQVKKDPRLKNPPIPKTEAQKDRERSRQQQQLFSLPSVSKNENSSSINLMKNSNGSAVKNNKNNSGLICGADGENPNVPVPSPRRPHTAGPNAAGDGASYHHQNQETQTPTRLLMNQNQNNNKYALLQPNQLRAPGTANSSSTNSHMLSGSHRGCTPKVDLGTRREALRAQFLKATNGVSIVTKPHFYKALNAITPWDVEADEFEELYDNCKQPNGKVHVDDFCHKFVEEYVQNSSSFNASMKPCFAQITKSPRYYHHPNLSLSRASSAAGSGANGNAGTNSNSINNGGGRDLLGRASIVAKAQREKEEKERQARRVVRLTRASELRKEVGAFFRKTVDSYDGYIQCGIIPTSPKRRPTSARRMASIGSAGVVNYATVHIPEPPLGTHKFLKINTRIEADPVQLGNQASPRVVSHRN